MVPCEETVDCRYVDSLEVRGVRRASTEGICLLNLPRKALEIGIVGWNGDGVCGSIDYGLRSYSTVISAASVVPPNDLPMLSARLVEQEAPSPGKSTASPCVDLSDHGSPQRSFRSGPFGKVSGTVSMFLRTSVDPPETLSLSTLSDPPL